MFLNLYKVLCNKGSVVFLGKINFNATISALYNLCSCVQFVFVVAYCLGLCWDITDLVLSFMF